MVQEIYKQNALPLADLEKIGLAKNGKLLIDKENLQALLSGKRTDMISLKDLSADGLNIKQLDAKLSVRPNEAGKLDLMVHPIYKEAKYPPYLTEDEAMQLEKGDATNQTMQITDSEGRKKDVLIEFDSDTKEFVVTDLDKVVTPEQVNNETLTAEQKDKYRKGKDVELSDGTAFRMSNTNSKGIVSNKTALVVSLLLDGGLSFLLITAINAMTRKKEHDAKANEYSVGYQQALKDMQAKAAQIKQAVKYAPGTKFNLNKEKMVIIPGKDRSDGKVHFYNADDKDMQSSLPVDKFAAKVKSGEIKICEGRDTANSIASEVNQSNQQSRGYSRTAAR